MHVSNGPANSSAGGPRRRGHLHFRIRTASSIPHRTGIAGLGAVTCRRRHACVALSSNTGQYRHPMPAAPGTAASRSPHPIPVGFGAAPGSSSRPKALEAWRQTVTNSARSSVEWADRRPGSSDRRGGIRNARCKMTRAVFHAKWTSSRGTGAMVSAPRPRPCAERRGGR